MEVETHSESTRGYSLMDVRETRPLGDRKHNATVIDEVDERGFYAKFMTLLETTGERR